MFATFMCFFFSAPVLRERVKKAVKVIGAEFHEM